MADHYKKKSLKAFKWNLLDQIIGQAILLIGNLVLLKLLTPRDFGLFAIPFVIVAFFRSIQDLGFSNLIVHDEKLSQKQYRSIQGLLLLLATGISALLFFTSPFLTHWTNEQESKSIIILLIPTILMYSYYFIGEAKLRQQLEFKHLFIINIIAAVLSYTAAIIAALAHYEYLSLVIRFLVYAFFLMAGVMFYSKKIYAPKFDFSSLKEGKKHALSIAAEDFLQYASTTLDSLFVGRFIGTEALGFYDRSQKMISNPIQQIAASFSKVLFPLLSRTKSDQSVTRSIYLKTTQLIIAFISTILVFIYFNASPIVYNLFGQQWMGIVPLVKIFCLLAFANTLISLAKYLFASTGQTHHILRFTMFFRPTLIVAVLLVTIYYQDIKTTALVYAFMSFAASIFFFLSSIKIIGLKVFKYIGNLGRTLGISGIATIIIMLLHNTIFPCFSLIDLISHGLIYCGTIILGHRILNTKSYKILYKIWQNYISSSL